MAALIGIGLVDKPEHVAAQRKQLAVPLLGARPGRRRRTPSPARSRRAARCCPRPKSRPGRRWPSAASVRLSSPLSTVRFDSATICEAWSIEPVASLTIVMFGSSPIRAIVSGSMFLPVRPGNVVNADRNRHGFGQGLEVLVKAFLRRLVVIGGDDQGRVGAVLFGEAWSAAAPRPCCWSRCRA